MEIDVIDRSEQHPTQNELYDIYLAHHPTVQELETYKDHCNYESTLHVTELKLEATKATPTVLEETMSIAQLFESGSPLWVQPGNSSGRRYVDRYLNRTQRPTR